MFHYRWYYEADATKARRILPHWGCAALFVGADWDADVLLVRLPRGLAPTEAAAEPPE
jgi:hypothetical protein